MKLRELLAGVPICAGSADLEMEISGVSYDSRTTRPGDLFVATTGFAPKRWQTVRRRCCASGVRQRRVPMCRRRIPAGRWR